MTDTSPPPREPAPVSLLERSESAVLETAIDLLGFDTANPPGDTREIVTWIEAFASPLDLDVERIAVDPAKPNLVIRIPGARDETLLFNGHLDTVPFDRSRWTRDPLGERDGDRLYGRGAADMKGALAAMLWTARAFAETGTTPPVSLAFAFVSDEETGGDAGLAAMLDTDLVEAAGCVIGETTCEGGRYSVTVADKGSIWLTIDARGEAAHGSRPMAGENAIDRLYEAITTLRTRFGTRSLSIDGAMAPIVDESAAFYEPVLPDGTARELFEAPTINLGTIEGGESINTVPERATAEVDIRLTAGVETRAVLAGIRECVAACDGVTLTDVSWSVGTYEPIESPLVDAVAAVAGEIVDDRVYRRSATGGGDAKTLRTAGVPTVEFGFGTDTVHAVDEYTTAEAIGRNAAAYAGLPYAFADRL